MDMASHSREDSIIGHWVRRGTHRAACSIVSRRLAAKCRLNPQTGGPALRWSYPSSSSGRIRLVLADDHAIVLQGLKRLFESHADFSVVECCLDGNQAVVAARSDSCDVLVLDLRM